MQILVLMSQLLLKEAQNVQFSCRIFSQDFGDFDSSYLWNGSRYQQMVKSFLLGFELSFILANKKIIKNFDAYAL